MPMNFVYAAVDPAVTPEETVGTPEAVAVVPEPPAEQVAGGWGASHWSSLIVAGIALLGVLWNTHRNDKGREKEIEAAAENRRKDQEAADERRRKDIERADKQRREENERAEKQRQLERDDRERERLEEIGMQERERQRKAVTDCLELINGELSNIYNATSRRFIESSGEHGNGMLALDKLLAMQEFYSKAIGAAMTLKVSIADDLVHARATDLWAQLSSDYKVLTAARGKGHEELLRVAVEHNPSNENLNTARAALIESAYTRFTRFPLSSYEHPERY